MPPIHNILHPTDFSAYSEAAFRLAEALTRDYSANLTVVHIRREPAMLAGSSSTAKQPPGEDWKSIHAQLLRLQSRGGNVRLFHRLEEGDPATEILRVADLIQADLIVMGTHGRGGIRRSMLGKVAERVLAGSTCPVLTTGAPLVVTAPAADTIAMPILRTSTA